MPFARARVGDFAAVAAAALLLSSAAIYNGFPLVWYDTGDHIANALTGRIHWARTIVYSLFIWPLHCRASLWPPVFAQAAIAAYLLRVTLRVVVGRVREVTYLGVVGLLSLSSSLPWFVGQIMPDVFAGLAVLGMFILGFGSGRLSAGERSGVLVLTALAIAVHLSHLPLALGLLAVMPIVGGLTGAWPSFRWRPLVAVGGALVLAAGAVVSTNVIYKGRVTLSPNGQVFMLARLVADGPAVAYLREHCPQEHFALCADLDRLPMDTASFLWRPGSPLESAGGPDALRAEAGAIVLGCVRSYPMWMLRSAAMNTMQQLRRFDTGWEYGPYVDREGMPGKWVPRAIHEFFPGLYPRYLSARQNMGTLRIGALLWPHRLAIGASLMLSILFLALRRRQDPMMAAFILFVGSSVLFGAIVTGVISGPADRYGSRMAWPIVLAALMSLLALRSQPGRDRRMAAAGEKGH